MKAIIEIDMGGAAFEDTANELGWLLRKLGNHLMELNELQESGIRDSNGNTCGTFRIEE